MSSHAPYDHYHLRLFVAGASPRSSTAIGNLRELVDLHLETEAIRVEVVDIYQQPELAREHQILGVPTLLRCQPAPPRRLLGDLSDRDRVLSLLDLSEHDQP